MATGPEYVATAAADPAQLRRALLHKGARGPVRACTSALHPTEGPRCTVGLASDFLTRSSPLNEQSRAVEGGQRAGRAGRNSGGLGQNPCAQERGRGAPKRSRRIVVALSDIQEQELLMAAGVEALLLAWKA